MSNIVKSYPVFESSQVLTSTQLNQLVSYLDQQNRLTRVKLIGMGIVCGLEVTFDDSGSDTEIIISKGTAITSEGFLLTLGDCTTSYFRSYNLPEGVEYKPFGNPDQDVTLFELLKELPEDATGVDAISDFDAQTAFALSDMFVLLFLECFDNDLKSCLGKTCDEQGQDRIFTIRKLLISKTDLDIVLTRSGNVGGLYPDKIDLRDVVMPRALFDPAELHSQDYTALSENFRDTFNSGVYSTLFGNMIDDLGALSDTYDVYEPLLGSIYDFENPFQTTTVTALKNTWKGFYEGTLSPGPTYLGMQYFYDFLKDLILAYNEFRDVAFDLMAECCPDLSLFPKHVMLGKAESTNETVEERDTYRHKFAQPPIFNNYKLMLEKTISLHKRLVLIVEKFDLDLVNNPGVGVQVHITPSNEKKTPLSQRSIPYYYRSHETSTIVGEGDLEYYWDFDNTRKKPAGTMPLTLSYENQIDDQTSIGTRFETPLFFDIDDHDFLRIEGHVNKNYVDVVNELDDLKNQFNLPFDIVALQLDTDSSELSINYDCGFEDLQEDYFITRETLCACVDDLITSIDYALKNQDDVFKDYADEDRAKIADDLNKLKELLEQLCKSLVECIKDFNFINFQALYQAVLEALVSLFLADPLLLDRMLIRKEVIDKFLNLVFYVDILNVHYGFKRREFYLKKAGVFSNYLQEHRGVEHQAGVYKGGTFILVYTDDEDDRVIADFNLPYLCCDKAPCIPLCDDEFVMDLPLFANPDFAVTLVDEPVEIELKSNDLNLFEKDITVKADDTSENGGKIELLSEAGRIRYTPIERFVGIDTFRYQLISEGGGLVEGDVAKGDSVAEGFVTVLVKEPEIDEVEGCYSRDILFCWGIKNVQFALDVRRIGSPDMNDEEKVNTLLISLRTTAGFTDDEIRFNILESGEIRRTLLNCLEIPNDANTSYEQLGQLIMDYQKENCGRIIIGNGKRIEVKENEIPVSELIRIIEIRGISVPGNANDKKIKDAIRKSESGFQFSRSEINLFTKNSITKLLATRGVEFSADSTKPQLVDLLFA